MINIKAISVIVAISSVLGVAPIAAVGQKAVINDNDINIQVGSV